MIDIKPYIAGLLKDITSVETAYPERFSDVPTAVITELDNSSGVILSGKERVSTISFQLDIYHTDVYKTEEKALEIDRILISRGFRRSFSQLITDERLPRRCMRYSFSIDEVSGRILRY